LTSEQNKVMHSNNTAKGNLKVFHQKRYRWSGFKNCRNSSDVSQLAIDGQIQNVMFLRKNMISTPVSYV
jgi:hypothetical protein